MDNQYQSKSEAAVYWEVYGGLRELYKSPYLRISFLATWLFYAAWTKAGWWDDVITITPSLLGFSLVAFTLVLALGNERFLKILAEQIIEGKKILPSAYLGTSAAFVHYILVQTLALMLGIVFKTWYAPMPEIFNKVVQQSGVSVDAFIHFTHYFWFFGFWVFLYSIACGVAATFRLLRLSIWIDALLRAKKPPKNESTRS